MPLALKALSLAVCACDPVCGDSPCAPAGNGSADPMMQKKAGSRNSLPELR